MYSLSALLITRGKAFQNFGAFRSIQHYSKAVFDVRLYLGENLIDIRSLESCHEVL